jgi:hypothetical protein
VNVRLVKTALVILLLLWAAALYVLLLIDNWNDHTGRAIALMSLGLFSLWVCAGGGLMWWFHVPLVRMAQRIPLGWRARFIFMATALALVEEAVATLMTNAAPLFGDTTGLAHITASSNYIEVVTRHSVVVFVPMFAGWSILLSWRSFSPFSVLVLFGISGMLAESLSFGPQNFLAAGFWILVYGLMVYLPASTVPAHRKPHARPWNYPVAVVFPILCAIPVALVVLWLGN